MFFFNQKFANLIFLFCLKGGDFQKIIAKAKKHKIILTDAQILNWMTQATNGLKYLHETCKIVHRDIKPA